MQNSVNTFHFKLKPNRKDSLNIAIKCIFESLNFSASDIKNNSIDYLIFNTLNILEFNKKEKINILRNLQNYDITIKQSIGFNSYFLDVATDEAIRYKLNDISSNTELKLKHINLYCMSSELLYYIFRNEIQRKKIIKLSKSINYFYKKIQYQCYN